MPTSFTCAHCGRTTLRNIRLQKDKPQKYCSFRECQNARRQEWRNVRYHEDAEYRDKCLGQQKMWRQKHSADQYQKTYRESHPEYVARNRDLQGQRNENRKVTQHTTPPPKHLIILQPGADGNWLLCEFAGSKIVNRYALCVYSSGHEGSGVLGLEGAKIVNRYALQARDP